MACGNNWLWGLGGLALGALGMWGIGRMGDDEISGIGRQMSPSASMHPQAASSMRFDMKRAKRNARKILKWAKANGWKGWNVYDQEIATDPCKSAAFGAGNHAYAFLYGNLGDDVSYRIEVYNSAKSAYYSALGACGTPGPALD